MTRPDVFNTHIHLPPNFSAFDTVEEALDQAAAEGCALLGASNYYDFSVYQPFVEGARRRGIYPTCGIEILCRDEQAAEAGLRYNDPSNPGKVYLCGKGLTLWREPTPRAQELMGRIRSADEDRMALMAEKLHEAFAALSVEGPGAQTVVDDVAQRHGLPARTVVLQERHLAQAYQEALFEQVEANNRAHFLEMLFGATAKSSDPIGMQNEIRTHLMKSGKRAFVEESFVSVEEGVELIRELGGIPAYPLVVDGMIPVSEIESDLSKLISRLMELEISATEFIANRNSQEALSEYVLKLWDSGIPTTCGTEHNTSERLPLLPRCKDGSPIPEPVMDIFWQSAMKIKEHEENARP